MELLCPNCQQKLTIPDQYAGQLMKCPLCGGTFTAPALPGGSGMAPPSPVTPPASPPVPPLSPVTPGAPAPGTYGLAPAPPLPPSGPYVTPTPPLPQPEFMPREAPPPPPPGDYTRSRTVWISPRVVPWVAPAGLILLFLLSLFPWVSLLQLNVAGLRPTFETVGHNLWSIAFHVAGSGAYLFYVILVMFLALPLSIVSVLIGQKLIPVPPALAMLVPWRSVIVLALVLLGWITLLIDYIHYNFSTINPSTIWLKLAFRVHFIVVLFLLLEFWLEVRRTRNLPPPKIEARW